MVISQDKLHIATATKTFVTLEEYRAIAETAKERSNDGESDAIAFFSSSGKSDH